MGELLEAYTDILRHAALEQYRVEYLAWAALRANQGPNFKPPGVPRILVEMNGSK